MGDNNILTFCPTVLDKKMPLSCLFFTCVCLFIELKKLHFAQFFLSVFVKFHNSQSFFTETEAELILQFSVAQVSSAKFQSMCFTMKI